MSSHREAPEIAKDPLADSTDLYAFRSPDAPDTVTIIAAVYPALRAGQYRIWGGDTCAQQEVTITPGAVAEVHWTVRPGGRGLVYSDAYGKLPEAAPRPRVPEEVRSR
jgi:hypothetical protein